MNLRIAMICAVLCGVASSYAQVKWNRDLEAAKKIAKKEKKLIFIDFYADWCGPCKQMDEQVFKVKAGSDALKGFITVKQDVDREGKNAARKYNVQAMPTLFVIDANGNPVLYSVGGMDASTLSRFLTEAKKRAAKAKK